MSGEGFQRTTCREELAGEKMNLDSRMSTMDKDHYQRELRCMGCSAGFEGAEVRFHYIDLNG